MLTKQDKKDLVEEIASLREELVVLRKEKSAVNKATGYIEEIEALKRRIADLHIEEERVKEGQERERREVEHMVGLERQRQEFEVEQAKRETKVELREVALEEQRKRFEEQMKFIENRLAKEVQYLKDDIVKALLERLPVVKWNAGDSNGHKDREEVDA